LQAKQAVALARFAGADRDAAEELREAETQLTNAENSWKAGRPEEMVDISARQAISTAVKAESTAAVRKDAREKRNEQVRSDAETRQAENRFQEATDQIADLKRQLADETRSRELSERDGINYSQQIRDLRTENGKLRDQLASLKLEADNAKSRLSSLEGEKQAADEQRLRQEKIDSLNANLPEFMQSLKRFGTVVKNERGIVLTMPESFWSAIRASNFAPNSDAKLISLGELLSRNPDYRLTIESHTDNKGAPEELDALTQQRSKALADRLVTFGVAENRIDAKGMGAALPVAPNTTNVSRAKNRRVQIILVPAM
jgi:outer membrane protein OmpA-like peptidoglycan-associated protein